VPFDLLALLLVFKNPVITHHVGSARYYSPNMTAAGTTLICFWISGLANSRSDKNGRRKRRRLPPPLPQFIQTRIAYVNCFDAREGLLRKRCLDGVRSLARHVREFTARGEASLGVDNHGLRRSLDGISILLGAEARHIPRINRNARHNRKRTTVPRMNKTVDCNGLMAKTTLDWPDRERIG
jgi:hypothetical protein